MDAADAAGVSAEAGGGRCPVCGRGRLRPWRRATARDAHLGAERVYELVRCDFCASAVTTGVAGDVGELYEGGTYAPERGSFTPLIEPLRRLADRDRMRFLDGLRPGASVLEVGAGDGKMVARMAARGLDARGIEPSPRASEAARSRGVAVTRASAESARIEPGSLDAVVVWHALEHLPDPASTIEHAHRWLRPAGRLIVAVPNLDSLQARIGGDRWFHQDVPRHRTHFTPKGLTALLARAGFRITRTRHLLVEHNPLGMWQTLLNRLTLERDFFFRLAKRDLPGVPRRTIVRDGLVTALAGPVLVPVALALELGAAAAKRGGTIVVEASR